MAPKEWKARRGGYENVDLVIPAPIEQHISGGQGRYQQCNSLKQALHVKEFEALAKSRRSAVALIIIFSCKCLGLLKVDGFVITHLPLTSRL